MEGYVRQLLKKAETELPVRPLVAVDDAIEALAELKRSECLEEIREALSVFARAILLSENLHFEVPDGTSPIDVLFSREWSQKVQRLISVCLLRLLCYNDACFQEVNLRIKTFDLFDRVFSEDLYKTLHINIKEQIYEKESKLKGVVSEIESDLSVFVASMDNLRVLPSFRQGFMQRLNRPVVRALILPFLPRGLLGLRLSALFAAVEDYLEEEGPRAIQFFEVAKELLDRYCSESDQFGTKYSFNYLGGLATRLSVLLQAHFDASPISKPAQLTVRKAEKKYPLHTEGTQIDLSFTIQNAGSGYAFDVFLDATARETIEINNPERYLGHISPGSMVLEIPALVQQSMKSTTIYIELRWINYDGSPGRHSSEFQIEGQREDIDWGALVHEEPYSLEPVTMENELVGRDEVLNRLIGQSRARSLGSSYVYGQKRVGKTSIVRTLESRLMRESPDDFLVIYLEGGDYVHPDAKTTVENLGRALCSEIQTSDKRLTNLESPSFSGALAPLTQFLRSAQVIVPDLRVLFILDEFDELPTELYQPGPLADSLFLTLRSISGKLPFGFILVGGEKMEFIISCQGDVLNKFSAIRVDYFDKEKHWSDFQSLVRKPTQDWLEISDNALVALYDQTSGNPYFTKLICRHLFNIMVQRRDCHATPKEVNEATKLALNETAANSFQHFWEDGIVDVSEKGESVSIERRKVLLAFAEAVRQYGYASKEGISQCARDYGLTETMVERHIRDFVRREVLLDRDGIYEPKVRLFGQWLIDKGIKDIIVTFPGLDQALITKKEQEEAVIPPIEIVELVQRWGTYRGRSITEDRVRAWLCRFGSNENQRLMFKILQGITFYTRDSIRSKMREAHGIVVRGLIHRIEGRRKRRDIVVSYLDKIGKSGAQYAKLYAEENEIYYENVVERGKLSRAIKETAELQALVFVDDFVGTGNSACEYFKKLSEECGEDLRSSGVRIFFICVCGFESAIAAIDKVLEEIHLPVKVHICDPLDDSAKCFSETSHILPEPSIRAKARELASSFGMRLQKRWPLGFGDCQAAVVFEDSCPNNSLPVLWDRSLSWTPLFERL
jgi:hypothetical protein